MSTLLKIKKNTISETYMKVYTTKDKTPTIVETYMKVYTIKDKKHHNC